MGEKPRSPVLIAGEIAYAGWKQSRPADQGEMAGYLAGYHAGFSARREPGPATAKMLEQISRREYIKLDEWEAMRAEFLAEWSINDERPGRRPGRGGES